ncbi:hypothetical protein WICPIJ_005237 [Wickerhamomyces pijperi]|uniref:Uncharacterized protein n=1 Tax=Wickerhamomyces pijperi TaxID=599730 RepID=A0A9P8TM61_WICPI|nr:hypothetical protein WICPIJ_005237 [Wickerhamomyces pijperi]
MEKLNTHNQIEPSLISAAISDAARASQSAEPTADNTNKTTTVTTTTTTNTATTTTNSDSTLHPTVPKGLATSTQAPASTVPQPTTATTATASSSKPLQTRKLKFVNSGPSNVFKPKSRMKPTFKITAQVPYQPSQASTSNDTSAVSTAMDSTIAATNNLDSSQRKITTKRPRIAPNDKSIIIEQRFDLQNNVFVNDNQTKQYQFQEQIKRPPGRPRKYPVDLNKVKRPQGRPRKNPLPHLDIISADSNSSSVASSSSAAASASASLLSGGNTTGKRKAFDLITMSVPPLKKQDTSAVQRADPNPIKFAQAILQSTAATAAHHLPSDSSNSSPVANLP